MNQTPLNAKHRELNAKLVDFSGWEMPLHYGSQIEEHHAVRRDAGMFDVSHMLPVDIKGEARPTGASGVPDESERVPAPASGSQPAAGANPAAPCSSPRPFLRQLLSNNVDKLQSTGRALYTCMLHEGGGVIDDLIVYYMNESWFRLVVNAGCAEKDVAWMEVQRDRLAPGLQIQPRRDLAMIAVQGPRAAEKLWAAMPGTESLTRTLKPFNAVLVGEMFIARTGYTGEDGFEVMLPARAAPFFWQALLDVGVKPCGLGARDTLRLEAGMNLYGQDMDASTTPFVCGLGWTVDLSGGRDFIGRDALLRLPRDRQQVGLVLLDKGVLRAHQKVYTTQGEGEITSGSFSPTMNASIALARVPVGVAVGDEVEVEIRDRRMKARVVNYPFVRNGKVLV